MRCALIDGDILAYRVLHRCTFEQEFDGDILGPYVDMKRVLEELDSEIQGFIQRSGCSEYVVLLTDRDSILYRKQLNPDYKGNRTGPKPLGLKTVADALEAHWRTQKEPSLEADDLMGILSSTRGSVIVSDDKDMLTIPGYVMKMDGSAKPRRVTKREAEYNFLIQIITGDRTDNYFGLPGVGPVGAAKLLGDFKSRKGAPRASEIREAHQSILDAYESKGFSASDVELQGRMAYILRPGDYDFNTKNIYLWSLNV